MIDSERAAQLTGRRHFVQEVHEASPPIRIADPWIPPLPLSDSERQQLVELAVAVPFRTTTPDMHQLIDGFFSEADKNSVTQNGLSGLSWLPASDIPKSWSVHIFTVDCKIGSWLEHGSMSDRFPQQNLNVRFLRLV